MVEEAIGGILDHPRWEKGCRGCELFKGDKHCPIRTNRSLLKGGRTNSDDQVFRNRLRDLIALAAANDQHVPLRQILTVIVNIVLGDREDQDNPLLTCAKAHARVAGERDQQDEPVRQRRRGEPRRGHATPLHHLLDPRKLRDRAGNDEPVRRTPPARDARNESSSSSSGSTRRMAMRCSLRCDRSTSEERESALN